MNCPAAIRPFPNDTEVRCDGEHAETGEPTHAGTLRDYAYPGSETHITWHEGDRRTFHGDWPGACDKLAGCTLPKDHRGKCAP